MYKRQIIIPDNRNYTQLLANLRSALPSTSVEAKCSGKSLKLGVKSIVDFRAVQHFLSARNISFHTFALPEEREVKIVIQGIPHHTSSDAIVQELTTLGYTPTAVSVLHAGKGDSKHPVNSFLVKLLKTGNFEEVYGLQTLLHLRVTIRSFDPVSYTHLDVYKRQQLHDAARQGAQIAAVFLPRYI